MTRHQNLSIIALDGDYSPKDKLPTHPHSYFLHNNAGEMLTIPFNPNCNLVPKSAFRPHSLYRLIVIVE